MKKSLIVVAVVAVLFSAACSRVRPSFSGVLVDNWASDDKGAIQPQGRGLVWFNPISQDLYIFPLHIQQQTYTQAEGNPISIRAGKDNTSVLIDAALMYQFAEQSIPQIFVKYRTDPETLANGYVYRAVRSAFMEAASDFAVMDLLGSGLTGLQTKAEELLKTNLGPEGIIVDQLLITGKPGIDPNIEAAINQTLQAIQEANREEQRVRQATAMAQQVREKAQGDADATLTRARAEAESAKLMQAQLTPLVIQNHALSKWDGKLPQITSGGIPLISLPTSVPAR